MKKLSIFVFVFALFAGLLFFGNQHFLTASSAQEIDAPLTAPKSDAKDFALAQVIENLTDRSAERITKRKNAEGMLMIDLNNGFQNVMLSKLDPSGEPEAACVTSLGEANEFFGRNLKTGELIYSAAPRTDENADSASLAARHGMSEKEFEFYKNLIEDAAAQRAANPNAATLNIVNADGVGEGFNDTTAVTPEGNNTGTTRGEQRLNLFNFAAGIWGAFLDSNVPINVRSQFNPLTPCTPAGGVLGSAGTTNGFSDFTNAPLPATFYHVALANKISGTDLNGATAEINATFNSSVDTGCLGGGSRFYYGLDNSTPGNTINLLVVLLHEMGHGLGFSSFVNGTTGALPNGLPDTYTLNMFDRTTNKYWNQMSDAERVTSARNNNNVLWDGANVRIASGFLTAGREVSTGRVQLYTPATFSAGSSISHFSTASFPNLLMEPNISDGLPLTLDLTRQQMRDIGWYRDTNADLIPDTIINIQPSGGTLVTGTNRLITWENTGGFNRNVTIELSLDGGTTYSPIATNIVNTGSFNFTVPGTLTTQGRIRVREYDFVAPSGVSSANFTIATSAAVNRKLFDFDGDNRADISVFRQSNGTWYLQQSTAGFSGTAFGLGTDKLAPADYDGDGKTDIAVVRNGTWFLLRSSLGFTGIAFGEGTDIPVPADYDGDGTSDIAVFRPSNGTWYLQQSSEGFKGFAFGQNGDKPVAADYDGDARTDIAVNRNGTWFIQRSQLGFIGVAFGDGNDKLVPADYDGDNKADIAVFRPSNGTWYIQQSAAGFIGVLFGLGTDVPVPADYDGDNKADIAVFRNGTWYLNRSTQGFTGIAFGAGTDLPAPNAFVR